MSSNNPTDQKNHLLGTVGSKTADGSSIYGSYAFQRVANVQKQMQSNGVVFSTVQESYQDGQLASQLDFWGCKRLEILVQDELGDEYNDYFGDYFESVAKQNKIADQNGGQKIKDHLEYKQEVDTTIINYFGQNNENASQNYSLEQNQTTEMVGFVAQSTTFVSSTTIQTQSQTQNQTNTKTQFETNTIMFNFFKKNTTTDDQVMGSETTHQIHDKFESTFAPSTDDQGTSFVQPVVSGMITGKVSGEVFGEIHQSNFRTDHSQHDGQDLDGDGYIDTPWGLETTTVQPNQITEFLVRDILDKIHFQVSICIKTSSDQNLLIIARDSSNPSAVVDNPDQLYPLNPAIISQIEWTKVSEILFRWEMSEVMAQGLSLEYIAANLRQQGYSIEAGSDGGVHKRYIRIVV